MSILTQKTVSKKISLEGIGIHSGLKAQASILPAHPNTGIIFKRIDMKKNNIIIPTYNNVIDATLCTTISNDFGAKVSTIEHLMGAFYGLGIDNAIVELNSQEVPILDGSAKQFVDLIMKAGIKTSEVPIKIIKVEQQIQIIEGDKNISINKSNVSLDIDFELKYKNKIIGNQKNKVKVYEDHLTDVYNSRTFCLFEDIEYIKKNGLAKGGSLDNAIVVKDEEILNPDGLRNNKEFVNHKILDCIGDLYTSGYRIVASIKCSQGGHYLTNQLLRKVFLNKENFSILEIKEKNLPHTLINRNLLKSIA